MFGDSPQTNAISIPFTPNAAVDAFAVMEANGTVVVNDKTFVKTKQFTAGAPPKLIYVNGPMDVASGAYGQCSLAMGVPAYAKATSTINEGGICGPTDSDWTLTADFPGFIALAADANGVVLVVRDPGPTICKGLLDGVLADTDATATVDNVVAMSGIVPVAAASDELTVQNQHDWDGDNDAVCEFMWNYTDGQWEMLQISCPA